MKERVISLTKTACILALAAFAAYQVSQLWLVSFTNHNFFLYLQARFPPAAPDGQSVWARPFRVISSTGDGYFTIRYSEIAESDAWFFGESALAAILSGGSFVGQRDMDLEHITEKPVYIYEYAFPMQADSFSRALGKRNGATLISAGISEFWSVAVVPPTEAEPVLRAFFIYGDDMWEFYLVLGGRRFPLEYHLTEIAPTRTDGLYFVKAGDGFAPRSNRTFTYRAVRVENPYQNAAGLLHFSSIRPRIENLFDSPATINNALSSDFIYTFSNFNTMVRYLPFNVIEYISYRTTARSAPADLMTDFSAALAFVNDDIYVQNETFFAGYETRDREHVFWFGYTVGGFPMVMQPWATRPDCRDPLPAPIEVVVDNGRVVRYRRLAYIFTPGDVTWIDLSSFDIDEPFSLGFPIDSGPDISLHVFTGE